MERERIAVIVLTWNTRDYTLACLASLAKQTLPHAVYLVDNASTDGTTDAVHHAFPTVRIIANRKNLGFASGNTIGLAAAFADGAETALVLNNDTFLAPDALALLTHEAEARPNAGIVNPLILFAALPDTVWFAGATLNPWTGRSRHQFYRAPRGAVEAETRAIARATGCAMLITRACYEKVGGFDRDLFMRYEDVAYSLKARDAGFAILLAPRAVVYHHVSAASGTAKSGNALYYDARNTLLTLNRYRPVCAPLRLARTLLVVMTMLIYAALPPRPFAYACDVLIGARDAMRGTGGKRET
jgi:GT2 family glycosyltransferase